MARRVDEFPPFERANEPATGAQRQAAFRARRDARMAELESENARLSRILAALDGDAAVEAGGRALLGERDWKEDGPAWVDALTAALRAAREAAEAEANGGARTAESPPVAGFWTSRAEAEAAIAELEANADVPVHGTNPTGGEG